MKARSAHAATVMSLCNIRTSYPSGSHRDSSVALKGKAARRWLFNLNLLIGVQAAINAGFDLPRQVMKPIPAKNRQGFVWPAIGIVLDPTDEFNNKLGAAAWDVIWSVVSGKRRAMAMLPLHVGHYPPESFVWLPVLRSRSLDRRPDRRNLRSESCSHLRGR